MNHSSSSNRRQINNELYARHANKQVKKIIKDHTPTEEQPALTIDFCCECSDRDCEERITLTIDQYEQLHKAQNQFIITPGHVTPAIEQVVAKDEDLTIVKKYAL